MQSLKDSDRGLQIIILGFISQIFTHPHPPSL